MNTDGGVSGKDVFQLDFVLIETAALLVSSITGGMALIFKRHNKAATLAC